MNKMNMEFRNMKLTAAEIIKRGGRPVLFTGLVYITISLILALLSPELFGNGMTQSQLDTMLKLYESGSFNELANMTARYMPSPKLYYINMLISLFMIILGTGYTIFLFNLLRAEKPEPGNLFDAFAFCPRLIILSMVKEFIISLGFILFFVPGIVMAYMYSQATYILIDDPKKGVVQCLRESRALMRGHKMERFRLSVSILGWVAVEMLPVICYVAELWTLPYLGMIRVMYYEKLLGREIKDVDTITENIKKQLPVK